MKTKLPLFIIWLSVSASCASVLPVPEGSGTEMPTQENASDGIPYPVPTLQDRLDYLEGKIVRLSNEVEMLNGKVKALEHTKIHPSGRTYVQKLDDRKLKEHYLNTEGGSASAHTVETAQNLYNQALKHYQNGRFSAAAALLKGADGGDGGSIAQRSMYLLLQSRARMGNCESVIEIGGRYANRFKDSPTAPEVIFKIGECQYRLQQKRHCKGDLAQPDTDLSRQPGGKTRRRSRTQTIVFPFFRFLPHPHQEGFMIQIGIIMGSNSDWPVMRQAAQFLEEFGVEYEARVVSAHRTPDLMFEYAETARARGIKAIIAGAGGAAHLPGMVAAKTTVPVLGVPVPSKYLRGEDSLLSIVQMPKGVPVATFAIGEAGAANAALFAISMLANENPELAQKLADFRAKQEQTVLNMELEQI